ncbi:MAG: N-acetyl-alpha-D-glucosaminyl L-malate synthase BshA [Planctomycetes bacterium]|nr:N-acetyl-alpha-D-glucosaminyl L-malate synthase BshA [Planctomycetota bacterium]
MHIGIACYPTLGGSGVVATELAAALAERGHHLNMFTYAPPHRAAHGVRLHLVDVAPYPLFKYPPYDLALASQIVDIVENGTPLDVLHVHYAVPHAISAFLAKQMLPGAPFVTVTTLHGTDISIVGSDPAYATVTRFGINQSDGVTAVSDSLKRDTVEKLGIAKPIAVIPNFVDCDFFKPIAKPARKEFRIAHASNFREVKRPLDVIKIFHRVSASIPARLSLIGDGPELPAALELARELKLTDKIDMIGAVSVPNLELADADAFLMPSSSESFGLSALESLACGVPVVATNIGGIPEVVTDGICGFLHSLGDVEAMANSLMMLHRDPRLRERLGVNARKRALEQFSENRIVTQYEQFYASVLAARN